MEKEKKGMIGGKVDLYVPSSAELSLPLILLFMFLWLVNLPSEVSRAIRCEVFCV